MVIETENLSKIYENNKGCRNINISAAEGEIYGFLGPNGAGKSTFIKTVVGLLFPTSGTAQILGKPIGDMETRKRIGYLPELFKYQEWMTGLDLLSFHSSLYKLDKKTSSAKIEEVLEIVNLKGAERSKIGTYSKGMQQRIGIASALLCDPKLLFLDEPTSALDPIGRKEVRDIMLKLKSMDKTVFLNSHLLSEVEMICDSAAIISKGNIIKQGKMNDLLEGNTILDIHVEDINNEILNKLEKFDEDLTFNGKNIKMHVKEDAEIHQIASLIISGGGKLYGLTPHRDSLEDLFIKLVEGGQN
ncbi:multidrug ABC transporter ATPase [Clostridium carboxidivorans P7]|uniref:ABC transporter related protein n=1 Tax=Clostridium carboxidivorans P7 TaxID=536227 RepID=C6PWA7_9CLOT|nr:ABC transporter ATP-binding protein [Clostridium carboxidivorans]AKN29749.1 multidrug ABC transporter ATPase [Clostridium carboxidivorans P7]EET86457.1 ABC transporter related protein [Clostridium carboxidivorans P7]EFG89307.1 putative bacitracin transport ATP-binding protein BcrA [Clostridium carboxidivorans P7]